MVLRGSIGMFISPAGEIIVNNGSHIQAVISDPARFGLTLEEIRAEYNKYEEPIGLEGKARRVLLDKVIRSGWIRLRRYTNRQWSVNVYQLDRKTLGRLESWGRAILAGLSGVKEADAYMAVVITKLLVEQETILTVKALSQNSTLNFLVMAT